MGQVSRALTAGDTLVISCSADLARDLKPGGSVAVEGVCLTAREVTARGFKADVSAETARRTTLPFLKAGDRVNLELPVGAGAPLGGHIVQGHVDGVGTVVDYRKVGAGYEFRFELPEALMRYVVPKGSVAVAGISLTAADVGDGFFTVAVIPFTYSNTTLQFRRPGDAVNIETDVLAKYVERFLTSAARSGLTWDKLAAWGYE